MWTEWVGGERRQTVITVTELQHRVAGWVTTAMAYSPEDRKRDDVSRWIDQTRQNIVTFASLGLIPVDRATFVLGQLREVAGPSGAQPIVVNVEPTPVVIENHVDASPKGDIAFAYDKLGRLAGLTRTPAEPS